MCNYWCVQLSVAILCIQTAYLLSTSTTPFTTLFIAVMSLANQAHKWISHDASSKQIVAAVVSGFAILLVVGMYGIFHLFGSIASCIAMLLLLGLGLRWVYSNGVGVMGWTSPLLRNSTVVRNSLSSNPQQKGTLRVVCISDTHTKHRSLTNIPVGDVLVHCNSWWDGPELFESGDIPSVTVSHGYCLWECIFSLLDIKSIKCGSVRQYYWS